jgi:thioredoxin 1
MSPSRDDGIAATTYLGDQTLEEARCRPCQAIPPVLEELAQAMAGRGVLLKVNVDESPALAARYGIRSIPTLLFFKEGTPVDRVVGAARKTVLQGIVNAQAS